MIDIISNFADSILYKVKQDENTHIIVKDDSIILKGIESMISQSNSSTYHEQKNSLYIPRVK